LDFTRSQLPALASPLDVAWASSGAVLPAQAAPADDALATDTANARA
jgi:hypothetical protein